MNIPLVGCASHRLNLATQHLISNNAQYQAIVETVSKLTSKLLGLKNASLLRNFTNRRPLKRNETRWSSTFMMLRRYQLLKPFITAANGFDAEVVQMLLHPFQENTLDQLLAVLTSVLQCSKMLQKDEDVYLYHVRRFFDTLILQVPDFKTYLGPDAAFCQNPLFEKAIIKVQLGNERDLEQEKANTIHVLSYVARDSNVQLLRTTFQSC